MKFAIIFVVSSFLVSTLVVAEITPGHLRDANVIGPCIGSLCPTGYDCRNNWCIFASSDIQGPSLSGSSSTVAPIEFSSTTSISEVLSSSSVPTSTSSTSPSSSKTILSSSSTSSPTTEEQRQIIGPCFLGYCPFDYECQNYWCVAPRRNDQAPVQIVSTSSSADPVTFTDISSSSTDFVTVTESPLTSSMASESTFDDVSTSTTFEASYSNEGSTVVNNEGTSTFKSSQGTFSVSFETSALPSTASSDVSPSLGSTSGITSSDALSSTVATSDSTPTTLETSSSSSSSRSSFITSSEESSESTDIEASSTKIFSSPSTIDLSSISTSVFSTSSQSASTVVTTDTSSSPSEVSSSEEVPESSSTTTSSSPSTTTISYEIVGPCIGHSCPDADSTCKYGFCVRPVSSTCRDKRFGCVFIAYLCNIFTDLMTDECSLTCKKC